MRKISGRGSFNEVVIRVKNQDDIDKTNYRLGSEVDVEILSGLKENDMVLN